MGTVASFKEYYAHVTQLLTNAPSHQQLIESIVNAPFHNKLHSTNLDLGIIVLTLVNIDTRTIDRIAHSKTMPAIDALSASPKSFEQIKIPLTSKVNITARAIATGKVFKTSDWHSLFTPALHAEEARFNQAESGMGCSFVYPLTKVGDGGALVYSFYQSIDMIGKKHEKFMKDYTALVSDLLRR